MPILRKAQSVVPLTVYILPKEVSPSMDPEDPCDVKERTGNLILTDRKRSLEQYAIRIHEHGSAAETRIRRVVFDQSTIYFFKIEDAPNTIKNQPLVMESVCHGNPLGPFAAKALFDLFPVALKYNVDKAAFKTHCSEVFSNALVLYNSTNPSDDKPHTVDEFASYVRVLNLDLIERCESRMEELGSKSQFIVKRKMTYAKDVEAEDWSLSEEQAYEEALLTRKPDTLTLHHMYGQVISANQGTCHKLSTLRDALTE
jgi:hypothetical protein